MNSLRDKIGVFTLWLLLVLCTGGIVYIALGDEFYIAIISGFVGYFMAQGLFWIFNKRDKGNSK